MERMRFDNIEIRRCGEINARGDAEYEIVQWSPYVGSTITEYCRVLAFIYKASEGYNVRSVGARPWELNEEESAIFNKLVKLFFEHMEENGSEE